METKTKFDDLVQFKRTDTAQQSEKDEDDSEGDDDSKDNDNSDYDDDDDDNNSDDSGGAVSVDVNELGNDDNSEEVQISDILCTTKSGRTCRTWKGRYLYY